MNTGIIFSIRAIFSLTSDLWQDFPFSYPLKAMEGCYYDAGFDLFSLSKHGTMTSVPSISFPWDLPNQFQQSTLGLLKEI